MATHQAKRPYAGSQPSITSYFPPSDPNTPANYSISSPSTPSSEYTAPLPDTIRANLLSVGMRVRKSVPEGYQTVPKNTFALFSDPSSPSTTNPPSPFNSNGSGGKKTGTRPRARELTPFCGILKVGGMATQAWGIYNPHAHGKEIEEMEMEEEEDECEWTPVSSQDSAVSMGYDQHSGFGNQNVVNANKRRFEDEGLEIEDMPMPIRGFGFGERRIAVPRRRNGTAAPLHKMPIHGGAFAFGQENAGFGAPGDFEDAEFLDYGLAEVEMGGV